MLKILKFFYSIWTVVSFMLLTIPMAMGYLLLKLVPYKKQINGVYIINRSALFIWSVLVGMRYKITGLENINKDKTYVVVVNHVNAADMMATAYGQRVPAKPLVKRELTLIPGLGQLFSLMCLPVDRSSKEARYQSKIRMLNDLKQGISVLIFPEGTRNRTKNPLIPFYDGAFELAIEAQVPVLPVVLTNIRKINRVDTLLVQPGTLEIAHLTPITTTGLSSNNLETLKQQTFLVMKAYLLQHDSYFKTQKTDRIPA
ncbi:MAG: 1-acyl-sn-glycerol-3-phosphate acyltransferase [Sphingobacteriales bacterium]|nr:1-acyl-sn-glycerol-3-phosphate acyltransferase [Sphingobacteriales bacterium]